eukprot:6212608-Pleurochrysis_carterae.AAC.1
MKFFAVSCGDRTQALHAQARARSCIDMCVGERAFVFRFVRAQSCERVLVPVPPRLFEHVCLTCTSLSGSMRLALVVLLCATYPACNARGKWVVGVGSLQPWNSFIRVHGISRAGHPRAGAPLLLFLRFEFCFLRAGAPTRPYWTADFTAEIVPSTLAPLDFLNIYAHLR